MKILAVSPFPPQKNGGSTSIYEFFSRMSKNGDYKFMVISYLESVKFTENLESIGLNLSTRMSTIRGIKFILKATLIGLKLLKKHDFDLVYGKNITSPSFVAFFLSVITRKHLVLHTSGGDIQEMDPDYKGFKLSKGIIFRLTIKFRKIVLKHASLIIANCFTDYEVLKKLGFKNKTVLIRNGVDTTRFHPPENKQFQDECRLIFVGRPEPEKNPDHILKIASQISNPLIMIGGTEEEFSKFGEIPSNVKVIGITNKIEKYYQKSDIFIQTSSSEGLSNALLEAMATGNVPITYPSGDSSYLIKNGENGFLCNALEEVIEKIKYLDNNKNELKKLSRNALKTILDEFDWNKSVKIMDNTLKTKFSKK